jgi:hypothetical protein
MSKTYLKSDHFNGGGSTGAPLNFGETFDASGSPLPKLDTAFHARTSHRTAKRDAATEGAIRLFGLQTP